MHLNSAKITNHFEGKPTKHAKREAPCVPTYKLDNVNDEKGSKYIKVKYISE